MNNVPVKEPDIKPRIIPETPEKTREKPIYIPDPFTLPTPKIKPGIEPSPKA